MAGVFTCVVDGVPHLVAADAASGLVNTVVLKDPLRTQHLELEEQNNWSDIQSRTSTVPD